MEQEEFLEKIFKKIDLFSKPIQLTINKKPSYKTVVGGVISLILLVSVIVILGFYLFDVFSHANPTFFVESSIFNEFPFYSLNASNYFIGLRIEDDSNNHLDQSYYEIIAFYDEWIYVNPNNRSNVLHYSNEINVTNCTESHIMPINVSTGLPEKKSENFLKKNILDTFQCINFDNRVVGGDWSNEKINFFSYYVKKCDNHTEKKYNVTCKSEEEYKSMSFYIAFKVLNYQIRPNNFEESVKVDLYYNYVALEEGLAKIITLTISNSTFISDDQLILGESNITGVLTFEQYKVDTRIHSKKGKINTLVEIDVYLTRNYKQYFRSYMKLQDVLGIVSGFLGMFVYAVSLFYNFYLSITYRYFLYNSILDFRLDERKDKENIELLMREDYDLYNKSPEMNKKSNLSVIYNIGNPEFLRLKLSEQVQDVENKDKEIVDSETNAKNVNLQSRASQQLQLIDLNEQPEQRRKSFIKLDDINDISFEKSDNGSDKNSVSLSENDRVSIKDDFKKKASRRLSEVQLTQRQTRLIKVIESFKKKREALQKISVTRTDYLCYKYFYYFRKKTDDHHKERKQIIKLSELEMFKRMDLLNLMKHLDQISLLEKSLLNKHQKFMLENKSKHVVYNRFLDDIETGAKEEKEEKISQLVEYIKKRKETNMLSKVDYVFLENVDNNIKKEVIKEVDVETINYKHN